MRKLSFRIFTLTVVMLISGSVRSHAECGGKEQVRNVILMIGDGMGLAQAQIAMMWSEHGLALERAQYIGLVKTYSANNRVTDSAAAATALSTGHKTNNGMVGIDADNNVVKNIMERAGEKGLGTGVVVTKDVTDATSAAFLAHNPERWHSEEIAVDIVRSNVDVLIGGGRNNFERRKDGLNLSDSLRGKGYTVAYDMEEVLAAENLKLAGLLADGNLKKMTDGRGDYLPVATAKALELLANNSPAGFILMIEGSMIDSAGHGNDPKLLVAETADFDNAVGVAFAFADNTPGTLVLVTGDHETGGLSIPSGVDDFTLSDQGVRASFGSKSHTAVMLPVYAYGAGAENFTTIMDNTDLPKKISKLLGLD